MAKLLKEEEVRALLTTDDALVVSVDAFRDVTRREAANVPRQRGALPGVTINALGAIPTAVDAMAMKVYPIVRQDMTVGSGFYYANPLECPKCRSVKSGPMRVIAPIENPAVTRRIIEHLGLRAPRAGGRCNEVRH